MQERETLREALLVRYLRLNVGSVFPSLSLVCSQSPSKLSEPTLPRSPRTSLPEVSILSRSGDNVSRLSRRSSRSPPSFRSSLPSILFFSFLSFFFSLFQVTLKFKTSSLSNGKQRRVVSLHLTELVSLN